MAAALPPYDLALDEMSIALSYVLLSSGAPIPPVVASAVPAQAAAPIAPKKEVPKKVEDDDDDFDVFGDDDAGGDKVEEAPKESRADMLARLKAEAVARTVAKEAKQRTLVAIEVKPWSTEQDLNALWKKITTEVVQGVFLESMGAPPPADGLKWGEGYQTPEVAFGIRKLCMTFTMGVNNSSDDVQEAIQAMEEDVQSVEVTSMNVL